MRYTIERFAGLQQQVDEHLLPASALFGAIFLLLVDNISRNLLATEIPIGILTAFVGAPFFLYLMTRKEHLL